MKNKQAIEKCKKVCGEKGFKATPQRIAVYSEIACRYDHPPVESIYSSVRKKHSRISFDTVFRTINLLVEIGLIKPVASQDGVKRFDANNGQHHHFYCTKCGKIYDFLSAYYDEIKIPDKLPDASKITGKKVMLEGICEKCNK
ncbi:MAG: transcriptional repressor [Candidatus Goldbacteria bacterium]|nr:transcriptional repressor [Candidatus Goldiibacteriota bacterium]